MDPSILNSLLGQQGGGGRIIDQNSDFRRLAITDSNGSVKTTIKVEIAADPNKRAKGLGGRITMDSDKGMLFLFDKKGKPNFWMKGMKIPIDFIWISDDRIVDILPNINPPREGESDANLPLYTAVVEFDKVLEVNTGFALAHNIQVGDKIKFVE